MSPPFDVSQLPADPDHGQECCDEPRKQTAGIVRTRDAAGC
jgi:hypothetical protein